MSPSVYDRLKRLIAEQLGVDEEEITPEASFAEDLNADKTEILDLVTSIEEEFGIEIPPSDVARYFTREEATVQDALDYLEEQAG